VKTKKNKKNKRKGPERKKDSYTHPHTKGQEHRPRNKRSGKPRGETIANLKNRGLGTEKGGKTIPLEIVSKASLRTITAQNRSYRDKNLEGAREYPKEKK